MTLTDEQIKRLIETANCPYCGNSGVVVDENRRFELVETECEWCVDRESAQSALSAQPAPCGEYVAVRADAVEWLKNHYPALCEKSGMCERVAGRLYTRTTLSAQPAKPAITEARVIELAKKAGFCFIHDGYGKPYDDVIQKFATLIAAEGKVK